MTEEARTQVSSDSRWTRSRSTRSFHRNAKYVVLDIKACISSSEGGQENVAFMISFYLTISSNLHSGRLLRPI